MARVLYVWGTPFRVLQRTPEMVRNLDMGAVSVPSSTMWLELERVSPRTLRAIIHEILHVIDEQGKLHLTHDQIRAISSGLDATLRDSRNYQDPVIRGLLP